MMLWYLKKNRIAFYKHTKWGWKNAINFHNDSAIQWTYYSHEQYLEEKRVSDEHTYDISHLRWCYGRMVEMHGEKPNVDYMLKFKAILDKADNEN